MRWRRKVWTLINCINSLQWLLTSSFLGPLGFANSSMTLPASSKTLTIRYKTKTLKTNWIQNFGPSLTKKSGNFSFTFSTFWRRCSEVLWLCVSMAFSCQEQSSWVVESHCASVHQILPPYGRPRVVLQLFFVVIQIDTNLLVMRSY